MIYFLFFFSLSIIIIIMDLAELIPTCSVCLFEYNDPYVVICGHSFCKACIDRVKKTAFSNKMIALCPECRTQLSIPQPNYALQSFIENIKGFMKNQDYVNQKKTQEAKKEPELIDLLKEDQIKSQQELLIPLFCGQCTDKISEDLLAEDYPYNRLREQVCANCRAEWDNASFSICNYSLVSPLDVDSLTTTNEFLNSNKKRTINDKSNNAPKVSKIERSTSPLPTIEIDYSIKSRACSKCHKIGHNQRSCRSKETKHQIPGLSNFSDQNRAWTEHPLPGQQGYYRVSSNGIHEIPIYSQKT